MASENNNTNASTVTITQIDKDGNIKTETVDKSTKKKAYEFMDISDVHKLIKSIKK